MPTTYTVKRYLIIEPYAVSMAALYNEAFHKITLARWSLHWYILKIDALC